MVFAEVFFAATEARLRADPHMRTHTIVTAEINAWKAEPIISCRYSYEKKPLPRKRDLRFLGKLESARAIFPELAPAVKDFII